MSRRALLATGVVLALTQAASAHPLDVGYLRVDNTDTHVGVSLEIDRGAAAILLGIPTDGVTTRVVEDRASELATLTYARAPITSAQTPCAWGAASGTLTGKTVRITSTATCATTGARGWRFPFVRESRISSSFELLVKETIAGSERLTLLDKAQFEIELGASAGASPVGFGGFVWSGIEHIGAAPSEWHGEGGLQLPDGIDHILFLLALMLGGGKLLQLVGIASGFTLGHSISLALAALDVVRPPGWLIEPLIALTIALAALEAFSGKLQRHRWKIASGFGLIHGFGFAAALTELELSTGAMVTALFGYNLGVELGQVVIVLVVAPLVLLAHRDRRTGTLIVRTGASLIFALGLYWFFVRAVG